MCTIVPLESVGLSQRARTECPTFCRSLSSSRAPSDHMTEKTMSSFRWLELMSLLSSLTGINPSSKSNAWRTYMHSNSWNITKSSVWRRIVLLRSHTAQWRTWRTLLLQSAWYTVHCNAVPTSSVLLSVTLVHSVKTINKHITKLFTI